MQEDALSLLNDVLPEGQIQNNNDKLMATPDILSSKNRI
jgi:hypothetical protein